LESKLHIIYEIMTKITMMKGMFLIEKLLGIVELKHM